MVRLFFQVDDQFSNEFLALEFLCRKVGVIHGDISMNNILINRIWDWDDDDCPTHFRIIACAHAQFLAYAESLDLSIPQSAVHVSASATSTAVVQASTTSAATTSFSVVQATSATAQAITFESAPVHEVSITSATFNSEQLTTFESNQSIPTFQAAHAASVLAATSALTATSAVATAAVATSSAASSAVASSTVNVEVYSRDLGPVDHTGTTEHIESAGMLIDCDFMRNEGQESNMTSVRNLNVVLCNDAQ